MSLKYLTPDTTVRMRQSLAEMQGALEVAKSIPDPTIAASVVAKIEKSIADLKSRYGEVHNPDGSVLVKHPAIGFITVEEAMVDEPVRLFASRVKALSTNRVKLYNADALVHADGHVTYENRVLLIDVEMSQMAFALLIANPGSGEYAATIRNLNGTEVSYDGDLNNIRGKLMFEETQGHTEGIAQWAKKIVAGAREAAEKGGSMSKGARDQMDHDAKVLETWGLSNPAYYAKRLAEFAASTTNDMKMEVIAANKIMGKK